MKSQMGVLAWQEPTKFGRLLTLVSCFLMAFALSSAAADAADIAGTATLSGKVDAPKPFRAAQVYILNVDKQIDYMVFTSNGTFKAVALFPGNYEVDAQARGLVSDIQKLTIAAGAHPTLNLSMHAADDPDRVPTSVYQKVPKLESYDEIYPNGPGKEVAEKVCMTCHGENWLPTIPGDQQAWQTKFDYMMGKALYDYDKVGLGQGALAPPAQTFHFGLQDRKDLLAYVTENYGPNVEKRAVRTTVPVPMDEAVLGKAEFIEYYMKESYAPSLDKATQPTQSGAVGEAGGGTRGRFGSFVQLDAKGNAWTTDSGATDQLVKLDPRTGEQTNYPVPVQGRGIIHDVHVARDGMIWTGNFGTKPNEEPMVFELNPETGKYKSFDPDPKNQVRSSVKSGMIGRCVDLKGNVWQNWMIPGVLSELAPETGEATIYRMPTNNTAPYGMYCDKDDNVWIGEWTASKIAEFNTTSKAWSEYTPPTYPANMRRGPNGDAQGNIWVSIWAAGKRPGMFDRLDPKTGLWTEWAIPMEGAQGYQPVATRDGDICAPSIWDGSDQSAPIICLNPRTGNFRFYPQPQIQSYSNKLVTTEEGSMWYPIRPTPYPGVGVLYPDKDKITTLGGYPQNGPPGYPYKVSASSEKSATKSSKGN